MNANDNVSDVPDVPAMSEGPLNNSSPKKPKKPPRPNPLSPSSTADHNAVPLIHQIKLEEISITDNKHKSVVDEFTVGPVGASTTVCPLRGTMSGLCTAVKKMSASGYFGGKSTKRRWFELDGTHFKWCHGHTRENEFKGIVPISSITRVYEGTDAEVLSKQASFTFTIETTARAYELGVELEKDKDLWLLALSFHMKRMAAERNKGKNLGRSWRNRSTSSTETGNTYFPEQNFSSIAARNPMVTDIVGDSLDGFVGINSNFKSLEYSTSLEKLADWAKDFDLGSVPAIVVQYPEYVRRHPLSDTSADQVVEVCLAIPSQDTGNTDKDASIAPRKSLGQVVVKSLTIQSRFYTGQPVQAILDYAVAKFANLGIKMPSTQIQNLILQESGKQDFLLHRHVPIGMFDCIDRCLRMKEKVNLSITCISDEEREALNHLIEEPCDAMLSRINKCYPVGFLAVDHSTFRKSLQKHVVEQEMNKTVTSVHEEDGILLWPKSLAKHQLIININQVKIPAIIDLTRYTTLQLETNLAMNGENLLKEPLITPLIIWVQQSDKSTIISPESALRTRMDISDLPCETRVVFRLMGRTAKGKLKEVAGANTMLFNHMDRMTTEDFELELTNISAAIDGEVIENADIDDEGRLSSETAAITGLVLVDEEGHEIPNFQALHLENCLPTVKDRSHLHDSSCSLSEDTSQTLQLVKLGVSFRMGKDKDLKGGYQIVSDQPSLHHLVEIMLKGSLRTRLDASDFIDDASMARLDELENSIKSLQALNTKDKELLWKARLMCLSRPNLLPSFLRAVDWTNPEHVKEAQSMLLLWKTGIPMDAIELLDILYSDSLIREYAVQRLEELDDNSLQTVMLQLVQVLKYEPYHDSALIRFLLRRALLAPLTIGHTLFWMLYNELHLPIVQERFGLLLTVYLMRVGRYRENLRKQVMLNNSLQEIAKDLKLEPSKAKRLEYARETLAEFNAVLIEQGPFSLCLSPKILLRSIRVQKCKVMESKKMPMWLVFENVDPSVPDFNIIFKDGDDLRQDQLTLQLIAFMDTLWREQSVDISDDVYAPRTQSHRFLSRSSMHVLLTESVLNTLERESISYGNAASLRMSVHRNSVGRNSVGLRSGGLGVFGRLSGKWSSPESIKSNSSRSSGHNATAGSNRGSAASSDASPVSAKKTLWGRMQHAVRGFDRSDLVNESLTYHKGRLDLKMKPYGCYSTGFNTGMLECVMASKTLAGIQTEYGGKVKGAFDKSTMKQYLQFHNPRPDDYDIAVENFIQTCAGYCVCTYVLGIGDRHADNIMIQKSGHFFHIDFGHFLGNFKQKLGINRERSPFVFTPEMAEVCKERFCRVKEASEKQGSPLGKAVTWSTEFESLCIRAFNILRQHAAIVINLFVLMIPATMPELTKRSEVEYIRDHLHLHLNDFEAADKFMSEIAQCHATFSRQIDNFLHNVKHY